MKEKRAVIIGKKKSQNKILHWSKRGVKYSVADEQQERHRQLVRNSSGWRNQALDYGSRAPLQTSSQEMFQMILMLHALYSHSLPSHSNQLSSTGFSDRKNQTLKTFPAQEINVWVSFFSSLSFSYQLFNVDMKNVVRIKHQSFPNYRVASSSVLKK